MHARRWWLVLACTPLTACLVSTSGLTGGEGGKPTADAGAAAETGPDDAAGAPDAAGSDAADGGDAGADAGPPFCASLSPLPTLCADFDEGAPASTGWNFQIFGAAGGDLTIDTSLATTRPGSLFTSLPAGTATLAPATTIGAVLGSTYGFQVDHVRLDFDLRVDALDPASAADVADIGYGTDGHYSLHLLVRPDVTTLQENIVSANTASYPQTKLPTIALATWTHITFDAKFSTSSVRVTIGDAPTIDHPMDSGAANGTLEIAVGAVYYVEQHVAASSVHHDNVVLRTE